LLVLIPSVKFIVTHWGHVTHRKHYAAGAFCIKVKLGYIIVRSKA